MTQTYGTLAVFVIIAGMLLSLGCIGEYEARPIGPASSAVGGKALDALLDQQGLYYRYALSGTSKDSKMSKEQLKANVSALLGTWKRIKSSSSDTAGSAYAKDPQFADHIEEIYGYIEKAEGQIHQGQTTDAHYTLEPVREIMRQMRTAAGIADQRDAITVFHSQMERVVSPTETGTALGKAQFAAMEEVFDPLSEGFGNLRALDAQEMGLDAKQQEMWSTQLDIIEEGMEEMQVAVEKADNAAAVKAGAKIKGAYKKLFEMAG